jgi:hypothetical protein
VCVCVCARVCVRVCVFVCAREWIEVRFGPGGGGWMSSWVVEVVVCRSRVPHSSSRLLTHLPPPPLQTRAVIENDKNARGLLGGGILRSNLANEEFIQWLPETLLQFAEQTGAGGFSFDLTYWEEGLPVASEYAQWAGWRSILSQLHTKRGGGGCGGASRCVVDNRQANHAWGAWMWALGGTYAEPLMSDEQPGSWPFYEADLHTDRLAGNKQRQVASDYRSQYVAPAPFVDYCNSVLKTSIFERV